jgi:hypothetical protein
MRSRSTLIDRPFGATFIAAGKWPDCGKDLPGAEIQILDAGHFALHQKSHENCPPHKKIFWDKQNRY